MGIKMKMIEMNIEKFEYDKPFNRFYINKKEIFKLTSEDVYPDVIIIRGKKDNVAFNYYNRGIVSEVYIQQRPISNKTPYSIHVMII